MNQSSKIYEKQLYQIWEQQAFSKSLKTVSGEEVAVLDIGELNIDSSGPDFKHARIRIGNLTYIGDLEIDTSYSDWKSHGHNIDNKYDRVILHASFSNKFHQQYVYTKDGRKIPTICLSEYLGSDIVSKISSRIDVDNVSKNHELRCSASCKELDLNIKKNLLAELGIQRFEKKCKKVYERLKELTYLRELNAKEPVVNYDLSPNFYEKEYSYKDFQVKAVWQQLLHELIFEALGYSKNKAIMLNLAQAVNIDFVKKLGHDESSLERLESTMFYVSGLTPKLNLIPKNESSDYLKRLDQNWGIIKSIYDGNTFIDAQWHFFKLRPQNFPTIRIAGGARIMHKILYNNLIPVILKKFREIKNLKVLINSLRSLFVVKSDGFWRKHYVFNHQANGDIKYFVGAARADEICVNVLLPFLSVYFNTFGSPQMAKKVLQIYNIFNQRAENKLIREVAENLDMTGQLNKTIYSQGMIELFRNFCSKNKCLDCSIGRIVFN